MLIRRTGDFDVESTFFYQGDDFVSHVGPFQVAEDDEELNQDGGLTIILSRVQSQCHLICKQAI